MTIHERALVSPLEMTKIWTVLGALVIQCAVARSWNNESYPEETYSVFGWIGYVKRFFAITLMLSGVILYYVPESRPHARKICYALIDLTADSLKAALSSRESDYACETMKPSYHQARYDPSMFAQKRVTRDIGDDNIDLERHRKNCVRSKVLVDSDGMLGNKEKKKLTEKQSKVDRQSRHRFRNSIVKDVSAEPCTEVVRPVYFYSDKLEDIQKHLKTNLPGGKRINGLSADNYACLISGSPQQMAMLDQKYEKGDVVIVQDFYPGVEYKECGTSMDKLLKSEASGSEQEGPTRDNDNDHATESGMETFLRDVELNSNPGNGTSRYSVDKSLYQSSQFQCGDECCGTNGGSVSTADLGTGEGVRNVLKSSRSMVSPHIYRTVEDSRESQPVRNNRENDRSLKPINSSNNPKADFRNQDKHEEAGFRYDNACRVRRKKSKQCDSLRGVCCKDHSYFTDRGGEADDENSQIGDRATSKDDLNQRPERDNCLYARHSDESVIDDAYDELYTLPDMNHRVKPALLRAVNWIFGGCPEAARRAARKREDVGKEESDGLSDEWLF